MALAHLIKPQVHLNLFEAAAWYQEQEPDSNLAVGLLDEFETVVALICERPAAFTIFEGVVRRAVLRRFPYAVYYEVEPDRIVVHRFLAMKQERGPAGSR